MMAEGLEAKNKPIETEHLERRVRELATLHEIARAVTSVLDLESVLNRIVEAAVYLTNAEEGFLLLVDEETGDLTLRAGKGLGEKASRVMSVKVTDSIAGQVVKTGRPVRMGGFRHDEEYKVKTGYLVKSLVNVPIRSAGRVIGVLAVDHSIASMRTFSDHDVALLSSLADYAAIAIQNANLFAEASAKADGLARALEEQTGRAPEVPSPEGDRRALEQFAQGLQAQREEVVRSIEGTREMARYLQSQVEHAEEVARRLELWDEEVQGLLPQLEWLGEAGLPRIRQAPALPPETATGGEVSTPPATSVPYSEFLQYLAEGALVCDVQGLIRQANQAAAQILGKPVDELTGSQLDHIVEDSRWERMVNSLQLTLAMGGVGESAPPVTVTSLCVDDRVIHAKLIPSYESQTGSATHIITLLRDVSAETRGWRARDEILTNLSQKLRGPMTAITSYGDLLLGDTDGLTDSMQHRYVQRIQSGVERLESVLSQLGEEPASSERTTPVLYHPTAEVINQTVEAMQNELSLEGVNVSRDIGPNLPPVQIESEYVSRILTDLLAAAGRRTSVGDSVDISTQVQFEDGGPGHLVVLIQNGRRIDQDISPLEEDEDVCTALALAEEAGGRFWTERKTDGSTLITLLLPVAESVLSSHQP